MKIKYIYIIVLWSMLGALNSCSIDNIEPINELTEENVVTDELSANALLNRVYTLHRNSDSRATRVVDMALGLSLSGIDQNLRIPVIPDLADFVNNEVRDDNSELIDYYTELYEIINTANFLIESLNDGDASDLSEERRTEMLAEARTMRAMAHFHALRIWGQFYDASSELGVVASLEPIRGAIALPRNSAQAVYDAILDDLQFGAENGPTGRERFYMSATFARALLAKVQLYLGDYTNAALNANAIINDSNDNFALYVAGPYTDIWAQRWENEEVLFAPFANGRTNNEDSGEGRKILFGARLSPILLNISDTSTGAVDGNLDPRYVSGFFGPLIKYPLNDSEEGNTYYYMRMAEVYLIHAEAEARRAGGVPGDALASLNAVRQRQAMPDKTFVDIPTLLSDIRDEKSLELFSETGESWFDLIRYHIAGDLDAFALKESLTNIDQFIFPIPISAIAGNPALVPNP